MLNVLEACGLLSFRMRKTEPNSRGTTFLKARHTLPQALDDRQVSTGSKKFTISWRAEPLSVRSLQTATGVARLANREGLLNEGGVSCSRFLSFTPRTTRPTP